MGKKLRRRNRRKEKLMTENHIKVILTAVFAFISSILGVLAVPVLLMVACNILDYATGLMASTYRSEDINSYKSIRGICNEIISILENIKDMGVTIPAFLIPLVTHVKSQVEDKVNMDNKEGTGDE